MKKLFVFLIALFTFSVLFCSCDCKHKECTDATCETPAICLKCGEKVGGTLEHKWQSATCTTPKTCSVCKATDGNAPGHIWESATCTEPKTCSVCDKVSGEALGHSWQDATCDSPKTCSVCKRTEGNKLTHEWIDATCTAPKTCSLCDKTTGEALGHSWQDATCDSPKTCSICKRTEGNKLTHEWIDATCTTPKTCSLCDKTTGEALGHSWQDATCDSPKTCSLCDKTTGEALGHSWQDATCDAPKTCSVCKKTEGNKLTHEWIDATCTAPKTCSLCKTTSGIPLEHTYKESITVVATCNENGTKKYTCVNCESSYSAPYALESYSADLIHDRTANSIGEILTYDKNGNGLALGTGFVYSSDGKIITNYHVIEGAYSAHITIGSSTYDIVSVLAYDKTIDIAVLKINATNLTPLVICTQEHHVGETVYAFGSSQGLTATFSQGIITYSNRELDGIHYVQHDAAISNGNSGGPLINKYSEVIGINTKGIKDSQNLNFAISTKELENLSYETTLTLPELYEKESDVFTKFKNLVINKGTYDSTKNEYQLTLGYFYSSDYSNKYTRVLYYDVADNQIQLFYFAESDSMTCGVLITIDEITGVYTWAYVDSLGFNMSGTLYANTFTSSTLLGYSHCNITNTDLRTTVRKLASTLVINLCSYLDQDLAQAGLTAEDLGFLYF